MTLTSASSSRAGDGHFFCKKPVIFLVFEPLQLLNAAIVSQKQPQTTCKQVGVSVSKKFYLEKQVMGQT